MCWFWCVCFRCFCLFSNASLLISRAPSSNASPSHPPPPSYRTQAELSDLAEQARDCDHDILCEQVAVKLEYKTSPGRAREGRAWRVTQDVVEEVVEPVTIFVRIGIAGKSGLRASPGGPSDGAAAAPGAGSRGLPATGMD